MDEIDGFRYAMVKILTYIFWFINIDWDQNIWL
jgi:hypothetical protein